MTDRLGDLWSTWTDDVLSGGPLLALLLLSALVWLVSIALVGGTASRRHRSPFWWALLVALLPMALASIGLLSPDVFPWIALGAAVVAVLLALLASWLVNRAVSTCPNGHELGPGWLHCPRCPPPKPAAPSGPARVAVGGPAMSPVGAGAAFPAQGFPAAAAPAARPARAPIPPSEVLVRLIAESSGTGDQVVGTQGALLGRNPAAEIALEDQSASWDHARIIERDGSPAVLDLGSSNGTFVNGERVETSLLISGDRLRVGDTVFRVVR